MAYSVLMDPEKALLQSSPSVDLKMDNSLVSAITKEKEPTREEQIAVKKLELLLDPDFRDFGIRFVNLEEYEGIIKGEAAPHGEIFVFQENEPDHFNPFLRGYDPTSKDSPSFLDYLETAERKGWARMAIAQTDWPDSTVNLEQYHILMELLKQSHREVLAEGTGGEEVRKMVLEKFREKLNRYSFDGQLDRAYLAYAAVNDIPESEVKISQLLPEEQATALKKLLDTAQLSWGHIGEGLLLPREIEEFIDALSAGALLKNRLWSLCGSICYGRLIVNKRTLADDFLFGGDDSPEALREAVNALAYSYKLKADDVMKPKGWDRQYQVAMVYSHAAIRNAENTDRWGVFNSKDDIRGGLVASHLLGAIAAIPNKELYQSMTELSSTAGAVAHPVLDSHGVVRYPIKEHRMLRPPEISVKNESSEVQFVEENEEKRLTNSFSQAIHEWQQILSKEIDPSEIKEAESSVTAEVASVFKMVRKELDQILTDGRITEGDEGEVYTVVEEAKALVESAVRESVLTIKGSLIAEPAAVLALYAKSWNGYVNDPQNNLSSEDTPVMLNFKKQLHHNLRGKLNYLADIPGSLSDMEKYVKCNNNCLAYLENKVVESLIEKGRRDRIASNCLYLLNTAEEMILKFLGEYVLGISLLPNFKSKLEYLVNHEKEIISKMKMNEYWNLPKELL